MKIINIILRIVLCLIIVTPILGALGIFPTPTPDLYNSQTSFAFIQMLYSTKYVLYIMALVFAVSIVLTAMNRMAIVALLILPIVVNIVSFHLFLDGGLFTGGAILADVLLIINIYFLWQNRGSYKILYGKNSLS